MTPLTNTERERVSDSILKIQSVQESLETIPLAKLPEIEEVHDCLRQADRTLRSALGYAKPQAQVQGTPVKRPKS